MRAEFKCGAITRTFNAETIKPMQLASIFRLDQASMLLTDQDGNCSLVNENVFDPPLSNGNSYLVEGTKLDDIANEMAAVAIRERDTAQLRGPARDDFITDLVESTQLGQRANMVYHGPQVAVFVQIIAVLAAATKDFSLISEKTPRDSFKRLRTPGSFQASLYQVVSAMSKAFQTADRAMNTIRAALSDLPDHFVRTLEMLEEDNPETTQKSLSRTLDKIVNASKKCAEQAEKADTSFNEVIVDIDELSQAALNIRTLTNEQLDSLEKEKNELANLRENLTKSEAELKQQYKEAIKGANEAQAEHQKTMEESGALGKMFFAALTDHGLKALKTVALGGGGMKAFKLVIGMAKELIPEDKTEGETSSSTFNLALEQEMLQALSQVSLDLSPTMDQVTINNHSIALKSHEGSVPESREGQELHRTIKKVGNFLTQNGNKLHEECVQKEMDQLKASIQQLISVCTKSHEERKALKEKTKVAKLSFQEALLNSETKRIEASQEVYKNSFDRQETLRKELKESQKELTNIIARWENLDISKTDFNDIIKYLHEGIEFLGKIKKNWVHLVHFFDGLQLMIVEHLSKYIDSFLEEANDRTSRRVMLQSALKATAFCIEISNCAHIYTLVSEKYVMEPIAGIGEQLGLTQEQARKEQMRIKELLKECENGVRELIKNERAKQEEQFRRKLRNYTGFLAESITYREPKLAIRD